MALRPTTLVHGPATGLALPPVTPARTPSSASLARAWRAATENRHGEALAALDADPTLGDRPETAFEAALIAARSLLALGEVDAALAAADEAGELASDAPFADADRAEALYRIGCCLLERGDAERAFEPLDAALDLCGTAWPHDRLRAGILEQRARCHQRLEDWRAARVDAERSVELSIGGGDVVEAAHACFQASIAAGRTGDDRMARFYAEEAIRVTAAPAHTSPRTGRTHLRCSSPQLAEEQARAVLEVLAGRPDSIDELCSAQILLGRALLEQGRHEEADTALREAERSGSARFLAAALAARTAAGCGL